MFFDNEVIRIRRERPLGGLKYGFSATFTAYVADIQPVEEQRVDLLGGRIGKTYEAFIDSDIDAREGDQAYSETTGKTYTIQAVSTFQGAGILDHKSLILIARD